MSTIILGKGIVMPEVPLGGHVYLWDTDFVAAGYGVKPAAILALKAKDAQEIVAGKHWVELSGVAAKGIFWTELGVLRLGLGVVSERGRLFRDLFEDLILAPLPDGPKAAEHASAVRALEAFFFLHFHRLKK